MAPSEVEFVVSVINHVSITGDYSIVQKMLLLNHIQPKAKWAGADYYGNNLTITFNPYAHLVEVAKKPSSAPTNGGFASSIFSLLDDRIAKVIDWMPASTDPNITEIQMAQGALGIQNAYLSKNVVSIASQFYDLYRFYDKIANDQNNPDNIPNNLGFRLVADSFLDSDLAGIKPGQKETNIVKANEKFLQDHGHPELVQQSKKIVKAIEDDVQNSSSVTINYEPGLLVDWTKLTKDITGQLDEVKNSTKTDPNPDLEARKAFLDNSKAREASIRGAANSAAFISEYVFKNSIAAEQIRTLASAWLSMDAGLQDFYRFSDNNQFAASMSLASGWIGAFNLLVSLTDNAQEKPEESIMKAVSDIGKFLNQMNEGLHEHLRLQDRMLEAILQSLQVNFTLAMQYLQNIQGDTQAIKKELLVQRNRLNEIQSNLGIQSYLLSQFVNQHLQEKLDKIDNDCFLTPSYNPGKTFPSDHFPSCFINARQLLSSIDVGKQYIPIPLEKDFGEASRQLSETNPGDGFDLLPTAFSSGLFETENSVRKAAKDLPSIKYWTLGVSLYAHLLMTYPDTDIGDKDIDATLKIVRSDATLMSQFQAALRRQTTLVALIEEYEASFEFLMKQSESLWNKAYLQEVNGYSSSSEHIDALTAGQYKSPSVTVSVFVPDGFSQEQASLLQTYTLLNKDGDWKNFLPPDLKKAIYHLRGSLEVAVEPYLTSANISISSQSALLFPLKGTCRNFYNLRFRLSWIDAIIKKKTEFAQITTDNQWAETKELNNETIFNQVKPVESIFIGTKQSNYCPQVFSYTEVVSKFQPSNVNEELFSRALKAWQPQPFFVAEAFSSDRERIRESANARFLSLALGALDTQDVLDLKFADDGLEKAADHVSFLKNLLRNVLAFAYANSYQNQSVLLTSFQGGQTKSLLDSADLLGFLFELLEKKQSPQLEEPQPIIPSYQPDFDFHQTPPGKKTQAPTPAPIPEADYFDGLRADLLKDPQSLPSQLSDQYKPLIAHLKELVSPKSSPLFAKDSEIDDFMLLSRALDAIAKEAKLLRSIPSSTKHLQTKKIKK
jgi:hypothetical protein